MEYDSDGDAQWASSTTTTASNISLFYGVSLDDNDNLYTGGYISGDAEFVFEDGISTTGDYASGANILMLMYAP